MGTWNAYGNQYWPAKYLIDAERPGPLRPLRRGRIRRDRSRDPHPAPREGRRGPRRRRLEGAGRGGQPGATRTPETYLGALRAEGWANGPIRPGEQELRRRTRPPVRRTSSPSPATGRSPATAPPRGDGAGDQRRASAPRRSSSSSAHPTARATSRSCSTESRSRTASPARTCKNGVATDRPPAPLPPGRPARGRAATPRAALRAGDLRLRVHLRLAATQRPGALADQSCMDGGSGPKARKANSRESSRESEASAKPCTGVDDQDRWQRGPGDPAKSSIARASGALVATRRAMDVLYQDGPRSGPSLVQVWPEDRANAWEPNVCASELAAVQSRHTHEHERWDEQSCACSVPLLAITNPNRIRALASPR